MPGHLNNLNDDPRQSSNSHKSSLSIFKNKETYKTIENPENTQPLLS